MLLLWSAWSALRHRPMIPVEVPKVA